MGRNRLVISAGLVAAMAVAGVGLATSAQAAAGLRTSLMTKTNAAGDGYDGTFTITNGSSAGIGDWTVAFVLPAQARITKSAGARLRTSGQQVLASGQGITAGGTVTFTFSVTGGTALPTDCLINGKPCPPETPSPEPTPTPSPTPTPTPTATQPAPPTTATTTTTPPAPPPPPPTTASTTPTADPSPSASSSH